MIATFEQVQTIVLSNPNKPLIDAGKEQADKLMLHVHGSGMTSHVQKMDYFENDDVYKERKKYALSNKDVFGRLLQQEDMIFSARGGSSYFNLPESEEKQMHGLLDDVRFGLSLRKWIKNFALNAYRVDPMGIIFMEIDTLQMDEYNQPFNTPNVYPTYKSIHCIYDYLPNGRRLEYVCFRLTVADALAFGITDEKLKELKADNETDYYRFVDDAKDLIIKKEGDKILLVTSIAQRNPLPNEWNRTPAFIISDLMDFANPLQFYSPLYLVTELADTFLCDRSVREIQKKLHGFAKAIEPLLTCAECKGEGSKEGEECEKCGGTGYKLKTKVSDVSKFPLEMLKEGSFDFRKVFGYVTPDITSWEKQDSSLDDLEELMEMTYWGTVRMTRPKPGNVTGGNNSQPITATESSSNDAPKEARLNQTADWAERTEMAIADFIGEYWFDSYKQSSIAYGRDYILKTADEYKDIYQDLRTKGAPDSALDNAFRKWKQAEYMNNPMQLAIEIKKFMVEPFPHLKVSEAKGIITDFTDYNCKLYFGEWSNTITDAYWATAKIAVLIDQMKKYVAAKGLKEPQPLPAKPVFN